MFHSLTIISSRTMALYAKYNSTVQFQLYVFLWLSLSLLSLSYFSFVHKWRRARTQASTEQSSRDVSWPCVHFWGTLDLVFQCLLIWKQVCNQLWLCFCCVLKRDFRSESRGADPQCSWLSETHPAGGTATRPPAPAGRWSDAGNFDPGWSRRGWSLWMAQKKKKEIHFKK